jgi:hypothetical protein
LERVRRNIFRNIFVALILLCSVLGKGQSIQGQRVFQIPYATLSGPNGIQESSVYIAAPFVRIGESWSAFNGRSPRSSQEAALQELVAALYRGDTAAAESRIAPPKEVASAKAFADYVAAFKGSLERMGEFQVEGYFPLNGRVRFVLRPVSAGTPYRIFTMREGAAGRLRFDETKEPGKVDSVLNTVFRVLKDKKLEVPDLPKDGYVTIKAEPGVQIALKAIRINADLDQLGSSVASPALQFYQTCLTVPDKQSLDKYFRCFPADVQSRLRSEFAKMNSDKQDQLLAMTSASRHVDFVIDSGFSWIVYYHSNAYSVMGRDWIQRTAGGDFILLNPMASFPLDDLISSREIRGAITSSLGINGRGAAGARGK